MVFRVSKEHRLVSRMTNFLACGKKEDESIPSEVLQETSWKNLRDAIFFQDFPLIVFKIFNG